MHNYLIFQLYGPMASWGEPAVGEMRHSALYPSKSAVIGLIAAALGIKRDKEEEQQALANSLTFGFKVMSDGSLLRDFHTTQAPGEDRKRMFATREQEINHSNKEKINPILSFRDYRCDAYAIAAVRVTDDGPASLAKIKAALEKPKFTLYLGRKSCPLALPLHPEVVEAKGVSTALNQFNTDIFSGIEATNSWKGFARHKPYFVWEGDGYDIKPDMSNTRTDMPTSRKRWQFAKRTEHRKVAEVK